MKCDLVKDLLNTYLDDELSLDEAQQVKSHLTDCPACRKELSELEKVKSLIGSLPRHPAPEGLLKTLEQNTGRQEEPRPSGLFWRYRWAISSLVAAAAAVLVVVSSLHYYTPRGMLSVPVGEKAVASKSAESSAPPENGLLSVLKKSEGKAPADVNNEPNKEEESDEAAKKLADGSGDDSKSKKRGLSKDAPSTPKVLLTDAIQGKDKETEKDFAITPNQESKDQLALGGIAGAKEGKGKNASENLRYVMISPGTAGSAVWYTGSLEDIIQEACSKKRLVLVYFYFSSRDSFPKNPDETLMRYSRERALFTQICVQIDKNGKIIEPKISEIFNKNKLNSSAQCVILDYYGNLIEKVTSMGTNKITAAIDSADKDIVEIESALSKNYAKAEKFGGEKKTAEQIKALRDIINKGYVGYETIKQAHNDLEALNQQAIDAKSAILAKYIDVDEYDADPDTAVKELETLIKTYKGLPAENDLREAIKVIKKSQAPAKK
ncbi:MAG: zf-HC2 domain-containing protein [Planctomycetota bacterium]